MAKKNEVKENEELKENVAQTEATETVEKKVANKNFKDKYNSTLYLKGTEFVIDDTVTETTKVTDKQYKITSKRAKELEVKKVVD